jgi:hypothetical protein
MTLIGIWKRRMKPKAILHEAFLNNSVIEDYFKEILSIKT